MRNFHSTHLVILVMLIGSAGCDATRELVKAPFDATTAVSNGTTQATGGVYSTIQRVYLQYHSRLCV